MASRSIFSFGEAPAPLIQIGAQKMSPDCAATTEDTATRKTIAIDESREWYSETEFLKK